MLLLSPACAGSSIWLASSARASDLVVSTMELQPGLLDASLSFTTYSQAAAEVADLQLLPQISTSPFQVLSFLLQHPFITLFAAGSLYFIVPRLVRASIRFVVVPAALALALYLISLNPSAAVDLARGSFDCALLRLHYNTACIPMAY